MAGKYAEGTKVPVSQSVTEIENTLRRWGADAFGYGQDGARAVVSFRMQGRMMRVEVAIPTIDDVPKRKPRSYSDTPPAERENKRAALERQRWRAMVLVIKAKCEAVELGIETVDQAWMPYVLLPDGTTVGQHMESQIAESYETGRMPSLLPGIGRAELGA